MAKTKKIKYIILAIILISPFFSFVKTTQAAALYLSPSSGSYAIGSKFSVSVYISSTDQAMNAASGVVSFPPDKLEVTSVSKSGSIFNLWVQDPSFSNTAGRVNFEGVVLNPGFTGSGGRAISINFKVKNGGDIPLNFASASVLANDGLGSNILNSTGSALFKVKEGASAPKTETPQTPETPATIEPAQASGTPAAPQVSSSTHPESETWYSNNNPEFSWTLPSGITGVSISSDQNPNSDPGSQSDGRISSHDYKDVDNGVRYFHIKLKNAAGWGAITHFRYQVDMEPPNEFTIAEIPKTNFLEPTARFTFTAQDKVSEIDRYEVRIDDANFEIWQDPGDHLYATPTLSSGQYLLTARAVDKAGNFLEKSIAFIIKTLEPPIITEYPEEIQGRKNLVLKGETQYPHTKIAVWLQKEGLNKAQEEITQTDANGDFTFTSEKKLANGIYTVWAEVVDISGARSPASEKVTVVVKPLELFKIGNLVINFMAVMVTLIALLILLFFVLWYSSHKFMVLRKRLRKEAHEKALVIQKAFNVLREGFKKKIAILEKTKKKRKLTKEEETIIKQCKKELSVAEGLIRDKKNSLKKQRTRTKIIVSLKQIKKAEKKLEKIAKPKKVKKSKPIKKAKVKIKTKKKK